MKKPKTALGLRSQQKTVRRQKIIDAARTLFAKRGFEKTTVDEIAAEAGFAWATVYKYFKTKNDLFWAAVYPELEEIFEAGGKVIAAPPMQPIDAVVTLLMCYTKWGNGWRDRDFLRAVSMSGLTRSGVSHELAIWANETLQTQISTLLRVLQRQNKIPPKINVEDMTIIIFDIFDREYLTYIHGDVTADQVIARIVRLMHTLLEPWNEYVKAVRKSSSKR